MSKSRRKSKTRNREAKKLLCKLPFLLLFLLAFLLVKLAEAYPEKIESIYSAKVYPWIYNAVSALTGAFDFSLAEILIFLLVITFIVGLIIVCYRLICHKMKLVKLLHILLNILIGTGIAVNLFLVMWGFNYYRENLVTTMNLTQKQHPFSDFENLCRDLIAEANSLRNGIGDEYDEELVKTELCLAYEELSKEYDVFKTVPKAAKGIKMSELLSHCGIAGIYIPFTAEANVNTHQPWLLQPFDSAHEMAHAMGFACEDEANFIAYLACMKADDEYIRYSGTFGALMYCLNRMSVLDENVYCELKELCSLDVDGDIKAYNAYWTEYDGVFMDAFSDINDAYLNANGQEEGEESYEMMIELLLDYRY